MMISVIMQLCHMFNNYLQCTLATECPLKAGLKKAHFFGSRKLPTNFEKLKISC